MKFSCSYTPRHWELGIGFYIGNWYVHAITERLTRHPSEIALMLGPLSFLVSFGHHTEVQTVEPDEFGQQILKAASAGTAAHLETLEDWPIYQCPKLKFLEDEK